MFAKFITAGLVGSALLATVAFAQSPTAPSESTKIAPATANPAAPASMTVAATMALALPTCPAGTKTEIAAWRAGCTRALMDASTNSIGTIHHNHALMRAGVAMRIAALMDSRMTIKGLRGSLSAIPLITAVMRTVPSDCAMNTSATARASPVFRKIETSVATWVRGSPKPEIAIAVRRLLKDGFDRRTRRLVTFRGTAGRSARSSGLRPWSSRRASTTLGSYQ